MKTTQICSKTKNRHLVPRWLGPVGLLVASFCLAGCWSGGPSPSGTVVQGPVRGATVFADRVTALDPTGNSKKDSGEVETVTDGNGKFTLPYPDYDYVIRTYNGTNIYTNKPALPSAAPAGATTVTPLTTMVASLPPGPQRDKVKASLEKLLGAPYDSDPTKAITPAALALTQSIEAAMSIVGNTVKQAGGTVSGLDVITSDQIAKIEATVAAKIAEKLFAMTAGEEAGLNTPTGIAAVISGAIPAAVAAVNAENSNVVISDATAMANAVSTAVTAVTTDIAKAYDPTATATSSLSTTTSGPEGTIVSSLVTQIDAKETAATNAVVSTVVAVSATTPDTTSPTATLAASPSATLIPLNAAFVATFSEAVDPTTISSTTFTLKYADTNAAIPGTITYNSQFNTATFVPGAPLPYNRSVVAAVTVGVKDLAGNPLAAAISGTFTTILSPLSGSGGNGGSGF